MNTIEQSIAEAVAKALREQLGNLPIPTPAPTTADKGVKIKGIRGLAAHLEVSACTAQALKNKGKVPFYTVGNRVYFFSNEVNAAVWKGGQK